MNNVQESHPDLNKDPKASEDFQRVKMAYDRLRSSQDEEERLRTSEKEYESREEEERRQGRGNTFKPGVNMKLIVMKHVAPA